jgi:hypothetical protein
MIGLHLKLLLWLLLGRWIECKNKSVLWLRYGLSPKDLIVVPNTVVLRGGEAFKRWGLVKGV